jgi:hypothetical protein
LRQGFFPLAVFVHLGLESTLVLRAFLDQLPLHLRHRLGQACEIRGLLLPASLQNLARFRSGLLGTLSPLCVLQKRRAVRASGSNASSAGFHLFRLSNPLRLKECAFLGELRGGVTIFLDWSARLCSRRAIFSKAVSSRAMFRPAAGRTTIAKARKAVSARFCMGETSSQTLFCLSSAGV